MALEKIKTLEKIEIMANGIVLAKYGISIVEDSNVLARTYERVSYSPGDDVSDADQQIKDVCKLMWTNEVVDAFRQEIADKLA